jgi:hypothetical protein
MISKPQPDSDQSRFEEVLTAWTWWDCPRGGIALLGGKPHRFLCEPDDHTDRYRHEFFLWPVSEQTVQAELAVWRLFVAARAQYDAGVRGVSLQTPEYLAAEDAAGLGQLPPADARLAIPHWRLDPDRSFVGRVPRHLVRWTFTGPADTDVGLDDRGVERAGEDATAALPAPGQNVQQAPRPDSESRDVSRAGTAVIGEDFGDEFGTWSGRWSAHWDADEGPEHRDGPHEVTAAEAIAWGRARADKVLIRPGDSDIYYSAGAVNVGDDGAVWPEGREPLPRREPSLAYLDRTDEVPPIQWRVDCGSTGGPEAPDDAAVNAMIALLSSDPTVAVAFRRQLDAYRNRRPVSFVVIAATHNAALELAHAALDRARTAARSSSDSNSPSARSWSSMSSPEPWEPESTQGA